jgi:hypothetical protein
VLTVVRAGCSPSFEQLAHGRSSMVNHASCMERMDPVTHARSVTCARERADCVHACRKIPNPFNNSGRKAIDAAQSG